MSGVKYFFYLFMLRQETNCVFSHDMNIDQGPSCDLALGMTKKSDGFRRSRNRILIMVSEIIFAPNYLNLLY